MRRALMVIAASCVLGSPAHASAPVVPTYQFGWGPIQTYPHPAGVATDAFGNLYLVLRGHAVVRKFDRLGNLLTQWGTLDVEGSANGQFTQPFGIAVAPSGDVYVADEGNNRIQRFSSDGAYLGKWGSLGVGIGRFDRPRAIAVDRDGNVYVADVNNSRIQKFNATGTYLSRWGSLGNGDGQFWGASGVAVSEEGDVYVSDAGNNRIVRFTNVGGFVSAWGDTGVGPGEFDLPWGVAVDNVGDVYVGEYTGDKVQKFTPSGGYIGTLGTGGSAPGEFIAPESLCADVAGDVYVTHNGAMSIQKFSGAGTAFGEAPPSFLFTAGSQGSGAGQFAGPEGLAVDAAGDYFVVDAGNTRVQRFTSTGTFVTQFSPLALGSPASKLGVYACPTGDTVIVADQVFNFLSTYVYSGGVYFNQGTTSGVTRPSGLTRGPNGVLYVTDYAANRVMMFTAFGAFLSNTGEWGSAGNGQGQFNGPSGIAVDRFGNVYVSEYTGNRVQKFGPAGNYLTGWGSAGSGPGQFNGAIGIAVDARDRVYVTDRFNCRVQVFTIDGMLLAQFGTCGAGPNMFDNPMEVAVDAAGNIYVPERGNHRVQKFVTPPAAFVSDVLDDDGFFAHLHVWRSSADSPGSGANVTHYEVQRNVTPLVVAGQPGIDATTGAGPPDWEVVGTIPATGAAEYDIVVPTTVNSDSTSLQYSRFKVWAVSDAPSVAYGTLTQYGYSVDNHPNVLAVEASPVSFALHGVLPNPARAGRMSVSFTLAHSGNARLEVFDVAGRRIVTRDAGVLGAGHHSVDVEAGRRLAPGIYMVRLTQGAESRTARVAVLD